MRDCTAQKINAASAEDTLASSVEHIRVAQENQILVIAPATADLIAKSADGLQDSEFALAVGDGDGQGVDDGLYFGPCP